MSEKSKKYIAVILKILLIVSALVWSFFMVVMTGAGLVFNCESYGHYIMQTGVFFIISGILMVSGTLLSLFRKKIQNIISVILSLTGFILCMIMLYRLVNHADHNGWTDNFTLTPISDMYKARIMPVIVPSVLSVATAVRNYFSYK
ncbi:MAG: hypothetical protein K2O29_06120 [Ruminococcus sp.]|nr:hypothetical protein [Ruminococcus sp.]MDE6848397.1 hypothetical protein [Ruminococcus sp.]MDE7138018.1 hypothetical protein [Ruminococcus sp.]